MSVTLHGNVICHELEGKVHPKDWRGYWRFSKDKSSQQQFTYNRVGHTVSRELVEFVSFLSEVNPVAVDSEAALLVARSSSGTKRKAGRPFKKSKKLKVKSALTVEEKQDPSLPASDSNHGVDGAGAEYNNKDAVRDALSEDGIDSSAVPEEGDAQSSLPLEIDLDVPHPLVGLWKGTFNVARAQGEIVSIEEEFFLYSLMTEHRPILLATLPPEPLFPYTIIQSKVRKMRKSSIDADSKDFAPDPTAAVKAAESSFIPANDITSPQCTKFTCTNEDSSDLRLASIEGTRTSFSNASACDPVTETSGEIDSNVAALAMYTKMHADELRNCVVLVGFGSNMYGRFSMSAVFDHSTNEFSCEKKYLTSKFSAKRGRRSFAECAAVAAIEGHPDPFSVNAAPPPAPPMLRQRIHSSSFASLDIEDESLKLRKRSEGTTARAKANKERTENAAGTAQKKSASKEAANTAVAASKAAALAGVNLTALVGKRNPDNDYPGHPYREAFMDCDSGEVYEGGWAYGCRYGRGICIYNDGLMYEGNWVLGKEQGKGCLMTGDRRLIYEGDWFDGFMHGSGKYIFGNGDIYKGDWREGTRHGRGEYTCSNGCRYSGEWKDNKRCGKGTFWWADGGSFYTGEWENDQRHGRGRLELVNGFSYDGAWLHNEIEGKGICKFPNGQEYEGTYKGGLREGRGTISFPEGAVYEGRFREDRFDGQGTLMIMKTLPGSDSDEIMIPVQVQSDFWRIHFKAGFGKDSH